MKNIRVLFFATVCFLWSNLFAEDRYTWAAQSFPNSYLQVLATLSGMGQAFPLALIMLGWRQAVRS